MMETMEKRAEMEGAIQKEKLGKDAKMEKMCLQLEHEREMAKIEVNKMRLEIEREKLAVQRERIRAEAAAFGRPSEPSGDGGNMMRIAARARISRRAHLMSVCISLTINVTFLLCLQALTCSAFRVLSF